jgi:hypothetical protein
MIKVFKDTKKRANEFAAYTAPDGTRYPRIPADLLEEVAEPTPPDEYLTAPENFYRTEQDNAPYVVYTRKSDEQIMAAAFAKFEQALTQHLDSVAQARRYDNRITCMVRAGFPGPFQAEGKAFAQWCDSCNAMAYLLMEQVQNGEIELPATTQELIDALPVMEWPA